MDPAVARLLDANANRAREGLRVMEDHARFVLDDAALSERIKQTRHRLSAACAALPCELLAARDVPADVGREISTPQEQTRNSPAAVAVAAARRLTEALRSLEEYAKIEPRVNQTDTVLMAATPLRTHHASGGTGPALTDSAIPDCVAQHETNWTAARSLAQEFEQLRYEAYNLEQQLILAGPRRQLLRRAPLHVLITESLCRAAWLDTAKAALDGGATVLQLREKSLDDKTLLDRAAQLRQLTRAAGALLIINDRPDIARLADADGVHVGQDDLPVHAAREIVGHHRIVGVSTHSIEQFRLAAQTDADYIAVGPMFASCTKPQDYTPGPALLAAAVSLTTVPIVAIGGIRAENIHELMTAGGRSIAVCESVIAAADPGEAAGRLIGAMVNARNIARDYSP